MIQANLQSSSVLLVGAGALGCSCLPYLVGAGVGQVTICDGDKVETTNLHRQVLFTECDVGRNKAKAAATRARAMNSGITVTAMPRHCAYDVWTMNLVIDHCVVVDCSDTVGARYLLNDICFLTKKLLISAAALGTEGSVTRWGTVNGGPCYRCVTPQPCLSEAGRQCADHGILGPVAGVLGAIQALEVHRCLAKFGDDNKKVCIFDGLRLRLFGLPAQRRACELCGEVQTLKSLRDMKSWAQTQGICVALKDKQ